MARAQTISLFWETRNEDILPIWTTKPDDHVVDGVTYPSMKKRYLEIADPTEHKFVNEAFGGDWKQWRAIQSSVQLSYMPGFKIHEWRDELEIKLRSLGTGAIIEEARDMTSKGRLSAAKWLAESGWKQKKAGRPTKEAVEKETKIQAAVKSQVADDAARLGMH